MKVDTLGVKMYTLRVKLDTPGVNIYTLRVKLDTLENEVLLSGTDDIHTASEARHYRSEARHSGIKLCTL